MRQRNIHNLVMDLDTGGYGIFTTTDIRDKIVAVDRNPSLTKLKDITSTPISTAEPEWTLKECSIEMQVVGVHHLPVVNENGDVIELNSATDISAAVDEIGYEIKESALIPSFH